MLNITSLNNLSAYINRFMERWIISLIDSVVNPFSTIRGASHTHTTARTHARTHAHTCIYVYIYYIYMYLYLSMYIYIYIHTHTYIYIHPHHMHARTHARTHACTHIDICHCNCSTVAVKRHGIIQPFVQNNPCIN